VGELRPAQLHPGRSALLGLIAAALGVRRHEEKRHQALSRDLRFAVRVDAPGLALRDYHTAQVLPAPRLGVALTRADELRGPRHELSTVLSWRDYRCDAVYTVATWTRAGASLSLDALATALERPVFALYLGRRSCPPSLPLAPRRVEAATVAEAFGAYFDPDWPAVAELYERDRGLTVYWEADEVPSGIAVEQTFTRRDVPLSRARWQFTARDELRGTLIEEVS
jgi:CRISPR system Cascade subunit CasD